MSANTMHVAKEKGLRYAQPFCGYPLMKREF